MRIKEKNNLSVLFNETLFIIIYISISFYYNVKESELCNINNKFLTFSSKLKKLKQMKKLTDWKKMQ